jgi:hypothetical protein
LKDAPFLNLVRAVVLMIAVRWLLVITQKILLPVSEANPSALLEGLAARRRVEAQALWADFRGVTLDRIVLLVALSVWGVPGAILATYSFRSTRVIAVLLSKRSDAEVSTKQGRLRA